MDLLGSLELSLFVYKVQYIIDMLIILISFKLAKKIQRWFPLINIFIFTSKYLNRSGCKKTNINSVFSQLEVLP